MPLKTWILDKMNRVNELFVRGDLPPRGEELRPAPSSLSGERHDLLLSGGEHLGIYAPLVGAIREELMRFVSAHLRHHLAIAEHDRFLLTSIEIEAEEGEPLELLRRFVQEFKPEQIKRFLSRELIGGLPNASAIDLSQFAGLRVPALEVATGQDGDEYADLLKALGSPGGSPEQAAYQVSLSGRWTEGAALLPAGGQAAAPASPGSGPTPLAGSKRAEIEICDARGQRLVPLGPLSAGRRLVIGKDPGCDLVVEGRYASRRHCEIWFERGSWWVLDAGSTNGIRVETSSGVQRQRTSEDPAGRGQPIELRPGSRLVLSAMAQGGAEDHPWLMLPVPPPAAPATPLAATSSVPSTPVTPIVSTSRGAARWRMTLHSAGGARSLELAPEALPVSLGRSRHETLVIEPVHESVSGHHLTLVSVEEAGVQVEVHGSNGVMLEGQLHGPGSRLRWLPQQTLLLGRPLAQEPPCTLQLTRAGDASTLPR